MALRDAAAAAPIHKASLHNPATLCHWSDGAIAGIGSGAANPATVGWNTYEVQAEGTPHLVATLNGKIITDA